jgi:hypothetical protein
MAKVVDLYGLKLGFELTPQVANLIVQAADLIMQAANPRIQVIEALFQRGIQNHLLEAVFQEVDTVFGEPHDKDYHCGKGSGQKKGKRYRRESGYNIVKKIPSGHEENIRNSWGEVK